jgi:hypothetical protein
VPVVLGSVHVAGSALPEVRMMEKEVAVPVPRAVSRHTAHRRVLLNALKAHVEHKHGDVVHLWGNQAAKPERA